MQRPVVFAMGGVLHDNSESGISYNNLKLLTYLNG